MVEKNLQESLNNLNNVTCKEYRLREKMSILRILEKCRKGKELLKLIPDIEKIIEDIINSLNIIDLLNSLDKKDYTEKYLAISYDYINFEKCYVERLKRTINCYYNYDEFKMFLL